jgi:DNA-binding beta-propeller fold protein YncE
MVRERNAARGFGTLAGVIAVLTLAPRALAQGPLPLETVADVALPGHATRMDYISVAPALHRVYLAHMGDGSVVAVDTVERKVVAETGGLPRVRGVLAVPELGKVYAGAAGSGEVVALDASSLAVLARVPAGNVDGLDYAPAVKRVFVTDQHGGNDVVLDAASDRVIDKIPVGGDVGNTRFDPGTGRILVAVGSTNTLVAIDPETMKVVGRFPLPGVEGAHGVALDPSTRTAFVAGEGNDTVCAFDLTRSAVTGVARVGEGVDVLDVDPGTHALFVASESGVVSVFDVAGGALRKTAEAFYAPGAHVVGVDRTTHLVYFPLADLNGHPALRIARVISR